MFQLGVSLRFTNEESAKAFCEAHDRISKLSEMMPWLTELSEIGDLLESAGKGLGVDNADPDETRRCRQPR